VLQKVIVDGPAAPVPAETDALLTLTGETTVVMWTDAEAPVPTADTAVLAFRDSVIVKV
jgi:hypothetical protein